MSNHTLPIAILQLPRLNKPLLTFARAVHDHLSENPRFPSPSPALTAFAADIDAFEVAETKAATKAKGAATERDAKKQKLKEDLAHLRDYVQSVVETQATSRDAAAVIESAFLSVKKTGKRSRDELSAKNTAVSGTVVLEARAVATAAVYYWQYRPHGPARPPPQMKLDRADGRRGRAGLSSYDLGESGARFEVEIQDGGTDPAIQTDPRLPRDPLVSLPATGSTHGSVCSAHGAASFHLLRHGGTGWKRSLSDAVRSTFTRRVSWPRC